MDFTDPRSEFRREVGEWLDRELTDELREEFAREITYLRVPMAWPPTKKPELPAYTPPLYRLSAKLWTLLPAVIRVGATHLRFHGLATIEYEYLSPKLVEDVAKCVKFVETFAASAKS